jgi:hypothetical protein
VVGEGGRKERVGLKEGRKEGRKEDKQRTQKVLEA